MEICFNWPGGGPTPAGAHCVRATGYNWVKGFLKLNVIQDPAQGKGLDINTKDAVNGARAVLNIGLGTDKRLWITNWPGGPANITNVVSESPK